MNLMTVVFLASFLCLGATENNTSNDYSEDYSGEYYSDEYEDKTGIALSEEEEECMPRGGGGPPPPPPDDDYDTEPTGPQRAGRARRRRRQRNRTQSQRQRPRNQTTRQRRRKPKRKNNETESEDSKAAPTRAARTSRSVNKSNSIQDSRSCEEYLKKLKQEFENMKGNGDIKKCIGRDREDCMMREMMKVRMAMNKEFPECKEQALTFYNPPVSETE